MSALERTRKRFKKITYAKAKEQTANVFQKWVRMVSANDLGLVKCVSCGRVMEWKKSHAGHFYPRATESTLLEKTNCHPQCPSCNTYRAHEAIHNYVDYMNARYTRKELARLAELRAKYKRESKAWFSKDELAELFVEYSERVKREHERIGE
jgi:hypothetical protein